MSEPIRILQVVATLNKGGIENLLMNLFREIDRSKFQFDFLVHKLEECQFNKEVESLGGRVYPIPRYSIWRCDKQFKEYDKFFRNHPEYRIVHSHIGRCSPGVLRSARKFGVPTRICHFHITNMKGGSLPFSYRCEKLIFPLISRYTTHRFACSKLSAEDGFGRKCNDAIILNNGIQTDKFRFCSTDRERKRKELGWNDKFVIIDVANLVDRKNHDFLLDVFNKIALRNKNVVLALAGLGGDGTLQVQIEEKIRRLGLDDYVQILGSRSDVPELLKAADFFLFPSFCEGFPVSLVEAQATGIPIVASTDITRETDLADLMKFVSLEESAEHWARIVLEEANRKRSPRETYAEVVKNAGFDISTSAKELTDFYLSEYQKNLNVQGRNNG